MGIVCVSVFFPVKKSFCKAGLCGSKAFGNLEDMGRDCKVCWKIELFSVDSQLKVLTKIVRAFARVFPSKVFGAGCRQIKMRIIQNRI